MNKITRDRFPAPVVNALRHRVHGFCSNPDCRRQTMGPHSDASKAVITGRASHITAASPNGPRYDETISSELRKSAENGIWLCNECAWKIDMDSSRFSVSLLLGWKLEAETYAENEMGYPRPTVPTVPESDFECPHCTTGFRRNQTICLGCNGRIMWGATYEERKTAALMCMTLSVMALIGCLGKLGIPIIDLKSGIAGMLPAYGCAFLAAVSGFTGIQMAERNGKGKGPRVVV